MDCYFMNTNNIQGLLSQVGCELDGTFIYGDECGDALEQILAMLKVEDKNNRNITRQLGLTEIIPKVLAPVLIHLEEEDAGEERQKIFDLSIQLLLTLTQPANTLFPDHLLCHPGHQHIISDINQILAGAESTFLHTLIAAAIIWHILGLLDEADGEKLTDADCETINCCLLLFRNILFISETDDAGECEATSHMLLLGAFFQAKLKEALIRLCTSKQHEYWAAASIQLISLLYKKKVVFRDGMDGRSSRRLAFSGSLSDSSSVHPGIHCKNGTCGLSCDMTSSGLEEDRMETARKVPSMEVPSEDAQSSFDSVFAYAGNSSVGQSWSCSGDSGGSGCGTANSSPADRQQAGWSTSDLPQEFQRLESEINVKLTFWKITKELDDLTEWLLQSKTFVNLVLDMKTLLCFNNTCDLPDLYYMWCLSYFLHHAEQLGIPLNAVRECLTVDIVGYLVYIGVSCCEQLLAMKIPQETSSIVRRTHLVVSALQEVFNAITHYSNLAMTEEDINYLKELKSCLLSMKDLRYLLLLMIRHCQPHIHSIHFLCDIIVANHHFLLLAESVVNESPKNNNFDMLSHISHFATQEVMGQYGRLLDNFEDNSAEVNDCVFTMMHHVAGDCMQHESLLQFNILKKFLEIWEKSNALPVECQDLMQYLLQRFINIAEERPFQCAEYLCQTWPQVTDGEDNMTCVAKNEGALYTDEENEDKEFLLFCEDSSRVKKEREPEENEGCVTDMELYSASQVHPLENQIGDIMPVEKCIAVLRDEGHDRHLQWLQRCLLDTCFIKLGGARDQHYPEEPVPLYHTLLEKSVPIVSYTEDQDKILQNRHFNMLLHSMGFHMPHDVENLYPRIPNFWNASHLLHKAEQLGTVDYSAEHFTKEDVDKCDEKVLEGMTSMSEPVPSSYKDFTPKRSSIHMMEGLWHMFVKHCNINNVKCDEIMAQ